MYVMYYKRKILKIPEVWNEMNTRQLIGVAKVIYKKLDILAGKLWLLKILAGMSWWKFLRFSEEELGTYIYLTDFLLKKNELTVQLLPKYRNLYGPASGLDNLKIKEFVFTELYYSEYNSSKNESDLDMLIAVLYRPGRKNYNCKMNPDGDVREAFNDNLIQHYARRIHRWPMYVRRAIVIWYTGCRNAWISQFDNVFAGGDGDPSKYGLWSMMRSVAKNGIFGDLEKVQEQYVTSILMDMDETVAEAKKLEQMNK